MVLSSSLGLSLVYHHCILIRSVIITFTVLDISNISKHYQPEFSSLFLSLLLSANRIYQKGPTTTTGQSKQTTTIVDVTVVVAACSLLAVVVVLVLVLVVFLMIAFCIGFVVMSSPIARKSEKHNHGPAEALP